jgi:ammonia channel protein AmtB
VKPLPSAFAGTEKTEILGLVDFTLRTSTLNRIRAIVVGIVAACIAYLAISFLPRIWFSARYAEGRRTLGPRS